MAAATHDDGPPGSNSAGGVEMMEANDLRRRGKPASDDRAAAAPSVERAFADQPVPSWRAVADLRGG